MYDEVMYSRKDSGRASFPSTALEILAERVDWNDKKMPPVAIDLQSSSMAVSWIRSHALCRFGHIVI